MVEAAGITADTWESRSTRPTRPLQGSGEPRHLNLPGHGPSKNRRLKALPGDVPSHVSHWGKLTVHPELLPWNAQVKTHEQDADKSDA
jgi:hypothetical protein